MDACFPWPQILLAINCVSATVVEASKWQIDPNIRLSLTQILATLDSDITTLPRGFSKVPML